MLFMHAPFMRDLSLPDEPRTLMQLPDDSSDVPCSQAVGERWATAGLPCEMASEGQQMYKMPVWQQQLETNLQLGSETYRGGMTPRL